MIGPAIMSTFCFVVTGAMVWFGYEIGGDMFSERYRPNGWFDYLLLSTICLTYLACTAGIFFGRNKLCASELDSRNLRTNRENHYSDEW